jgi:poly(hydroxyalkanoate) granule-associated protein
MTRKTPIRKAPARRTAKPVRKFKSSLNAATPVQKAWLAGVDAATNARAVAGEAVGKVMKQANILVKQGRALQVRSKRAAIHRAEEAKTVAMARAGEARTRAVEAVSHLERVFEQRVSKVLGKLGVPTSQSVKTLTRRVAELQANVDQLRRARARA